MKNLIIFLLCSFSFTIQAQHQVSGVINTPSNEPIFYANAVLFNLQDSSLIKGEISNDKGLFTIKNIKDGEYYVQASMLGYQKQYSETFTFPNPNPIFLKLSLKEDAELLSTVEITARKPLLEQKADKLVVNIEDNLSSMNSNLMDVMKQVPGMLVVNDKLSMAGQSNVTILINGKTTKYMDIQSLMRDMPGDNIKSVEIIHQPGAEYDASGSGPIINIVLKKNNLFGTNGIITAGIGQAYETKYNTGLRLSHYQGDINIQGSASLTRGSWYEETSITRRIKRNTNGEESTDIFDSVNRNPGEPLSYRFGMAIDWDIKDNHRIGFGARYIDSETNKLAINTTDITLRSNDPLQIITENEGNSNWSMASFNPYYEWKIDSSKQTLDIDANWVQYKINSISNLDFITNSNAFMLSNQINDQPSDTEITAFRIDYKNILSPKVTLKAGGKYSMANLDNELSVQNQNSNGEWINNLQQSNQFLFDETVKALYTKAEFSLGDWNGTAGLRYEHSISNGYSVTVDSTQKRIISQLFPSASLSRKIGGPLGAALSYSYRIDRPRYSTLNPFVYYYDAFTSERGNPLVRPELTNSFKFSLTYNSQPFFNIEYKRSKDALVDVTEQNDESGEASRLTVNLDKFTNTNMSLFLPLEMFSPLTGYTGIILNKNAYDAPYLDGQFNQSKWSLTAVFNANYSLPYEINGEFNSWYTSGDQEGIMNSDWLYGVNLGFSKKFLDDKLKLSFGVQDLFNRFYTATIDYANMDVDIESKWANNVVNFRASYKFGNQHMKSKKKKGGSARSEMSRVKTN